MSDKKRTKIVTFRLKQAEIDVLRKKCNTKSVSDYIRHHILYCNNDVHFVIHDTFVRQNQPNVIQKDTHDLPIVIPSLEHLCEDCNEKQKYHTPLNKWYCDSNHCRPKT